MKFEVPAITTPTNAVTRVSVYAGGVLSNVNFGSTESTINASFSIANASATEGSSVTFKITLSHAVDADTFTVVLTAQPLTNVVLNLASGRTTEVTVSPATVTFTTSNWNAA